MIKCRIKRYDKRFKNPPLRFVLLGEFECEDRKDMYLVLINKVMNWSRDSKYMFGFYSMSKDSRYKYDVVVRENE